MGSYQPFLNPFKKKKLISRMINSAVYFIQFVFILQETNHFRLIAIQDMNKVTDKNYKTIKGAKIACAQLLRKQAPKKGMKPVWSFLYPPDEKWLKDKLGRKKGLLMLKEKEKDATGSMPGTYGTLELEPAVVL
jgi:hypothetical protein